MKSNGIVKFLLIFLLAGILGGVLFGFLLAMCLLGIFYSPESLVFFAIIVALFYFVSIWRQVRQKNYGVIIRRLFEIIVFSSLINAMFLLEEEIIQFNSFDWNVIYFCVGLVILVMTTFVMLEEYFNQSWLAKEINHIINGMQIYGLLPNKQEEEEEEEEEEEKKK